MFGLMNLIKIKLIFLNYKTNLIVIGHDMLVDMRGDELIIVWLYVCVIYGLFI